MSENATVLTHDQIASLWVRYGGPKSKADMAAAIAQAESGGNLSATNFNSNGSVDRGLFQINSIHGPLSSYEYDKNVKAAILISHAGTNWRPWCTAYSDGACGTKGGCYECNGAPYRKFLTGRFVSVPVDDATLFAITQQQSTPAQKQDAQGNAIPQGITGGAATGILHAVNPLSWAKGLASLLSHLLDPKFWLRIGQGVAAVGLIVLGIILVFRKQIEPLAQQGAKAAEVAAVA